MAETLREFLVEVGFVVDEASRKKAIDKANQTQDQITAAAEEHGQQRVDRETFRQALLAKGNDLGKVRIVEQEKRAATAITKVQKDSADRVARIETDAPKKAKERRDGAFKDLAKGALATEATLVKVGATLATVGTALTGSAFFRSVMGAAGDYANLRQQSLRTGASVKGVQSLLYGFAQLGIGRDETNNAFEGFRSSLASNPGLKSMLKGAGIDPEQPVDQVFAQLGRYFRTMPYNVQIARAGQLGISENVLRGLDDPALAGKIGEGAAKPEQFGLDPDKAARDATALTTSYDRLTTDLGTVKDKLEAVFFKPMAAGFNAIADAMEGHANAVSRFGEGMVAFSGLMAARVVPTLVKLVMKVSGLGAALSSLPGWVITMLLADAATHPLNAGEPYKPPSNAMFDPNAQDGRWVGGSGIALPRSESRAGRLWRQRPQWMGGEGKGGARQRLGHLDDLPTGPVAGASGYGLIDAPYRASVDRKGEGGYLSPREMYNYLRAQGASENEALMLTGAAGSESSFNPNAIHDGGNGHDLFGHNDGRLNMQGKAWQQQASDALNELRRRSEHALVDAAKTDEDLADAEAHYEQPRGYTRRNPRGADNYTGRLGTIRRFRSQFAPGKGANLSTTGGPPRGTPAFAQWGGITDPRSLMTSPPKLTSPLGVTPSMFTTDNSSVRGDTNFTQNVTVHGASDPGAVASAIKLNADRGSKDFVRNLQGATQ